MEPPSSAGGKDPRSLGTGMGSSGSQFRSTSWTKLADVMATDSSRRSEALRDLFQEYWRPIYSYLRTGFRLGQEEAKDRTQDFFLWTLETGFFEKADRQRGCFRGLLKTALKNFVLMSERKEGCLKRGGRAHHFSLNLETDASLDLPSSTDTPEEALDRQWREALLKHGLNALRTAYGKEGEETYALALEAFHLEHSSYEEIALRFNIPKKDVQPILLAARRRLAEVLVDLVAETVTSQEDLQREFQALFG